MKTLSTILLLGILLLNSCSTIKSKQSTNVYENCLPSLFKEDLVKLTFSFEAFLNRNHDGQMEEFVQEITDMKFPNREAFIPKDYEIGNALRQRNFKDYIYTEYEENLSDSEDEVQPPRTASDGDEDLKRMKIKVDPKKPYLNCLSNTETKGELIKQYVKLQTANPSLSPLVIGSFFLKNNKDLDFNTNLTKKIIAVELYYMILDSVTK